MSNYINTISTLERRFQSGNSVPVESARITKEEFNAIKEEILIMKKILQEHDIYFIRVDTLDSDL